MQMKRHSQVQNMISNSDCLCTDRPSDAIGYLILPAMICISNVAGSIFVFSGIGII